MPPLPFNNPLLVENGWRPPPPPGFPDNMPPRRYRALHFHTGSEPWCTWTSHLVVSSVAGARVMARFVVVVVVGCLRSGCCSRLFSCPHRGWYPCLCFGSRVCVRFCCVHGRIRGGRREYGNGHLAHLA
jgi:hypothetical protein